MGDQAHQNARRTETALDAVLARTSLSPPGEQP